MARIAESSAAEEKPNNPSMADSNPDTLTALAVQQFKHQLKQTLDQTIPWREYAIQQAQLTSKTIEDAVDSAVVTSRHRLSEIRSTSSAHFHQTMDSLQDLKAEYLSYENILFGKLKEGVNIATSNPIITGGVVAGLGFMVLKRPRQFLYYNTLRLFVSEESLLSKADAKVKELKRSIDLLKAESEKLERRASVAEEELIRGRTKLRQAGDQIQGVIRSAYKIERQAGGMQDIFRELPSREASRFQSQVSNLASEAKQERKALTKEVTKISNYGIPV